MLLWIIRIPRRSKTLVDLDVIILVEDGEWVLDHSQVILIAEGEYCCCDVDSDEPTCWHRKENYFPLDRIWKHTLNIKPLKRVAAAARNYAASGKVEQTYKTTRFLQRNSSLSLLTKEEKVESLEHHFLLLWTYWNLKLELRPRRPE